MVISGTLQYTDWSNSPNYLHPLSSRGVAVYKKNFKYSTTQFVSGLSFMYNFEINIYNQKISQLKSSFIQEFSKILAFYRAKFDKIHVLLI